MTLMPNYQLSLKNTYCSKCQCFFFICDGYTYSGFQAVLLVGATTAVLTLDYKTNVIELFDNVKVVYKKSG